WNKKVDKVNELLFGASYRLKYYKDNTGLSTDSITSTDNYLHVGGIFLEDELSLAVNHKLLIGSRFEYNNSSGPVATPRMVYKWNSMDEKNVIRISLGTGYRTPNLLNDGFGALNGSRKIFVAEKLKSEYAVTPSANYTRVQELKGGLLNLDFSAFYTYFTNYINPDYDQNPALIVYSNTKGGAMAPGFSANADFTFNYPLKVGVGFTYVNVFEINIDEQGKKQREEPQHSPPFTAQFYFSYNFPIPQLSLDYIGNLISPMLLSTVPNDFRPSHSTWFTIQNIQVTKKFKNGMEIYAGIKNLFNFIQKDPILRPFDPFNRDVANNNPNNYRFDTTYGFMTMEGIKGFVGFRYTLR
ncbi:MAG: TonB-dependent receptor, partial [Bacteroidota bacterium]|nr:TonB-dependent receptor [Bacteroidota bacterium]